MPRSLRKTELEKTNLKELNKIAKEYKIKGRSKMRKDPLIEAILKHEKEIKKKKKSTAQQAVKLQCKKLRKTKHPKCGEQPHCEWKGGKCQDRVDMDEEMEDQEIEAQKSKSKSKKKPSKKKRKSLRKRRKSLQRKSLQRDRKLGVPFVILEHN